MATSIDVAQALQDGTCTLQPNGKYLCVCNTELLKASIKRHLASKRHLEKNHLEKTRKMTHSMLAPQSEVAQALQDGTLTLQPNGKYFCVCKSEIVKSSINKHLASAKHKMVTQKLLEETKNRSDEKQALQDGTCTLQPNGKYLCVCNAELVKASIKKHLTSKKHLEKVSRQAVRGPSRPGKDSNTNHLEKTRKMTHSMLAPQSEVAQALQDGTLTLQSNGKYLCVCKSEIVKSSINKHLASAKHKLSLSTSTEPYRMASQPRGNVYIFNYKFTGKHNYRSGAEHDSETIQATFTNMGYRVFTKEDLSRRATLMELKLIRDEESTRDVDSMIMFILSHGKGVRDFLTEDGLSLCLSRIHQMFTDAQCPALRGKPKIFFTNFCRKGVFETCPVFESSDPPRDMVTIHAAGEGIDALRNTAFGTYFIRNLCQVLQEHAGEKSLREIYLELDRSAAERGGTQPMWEDFVFRNFYFSPTKSNTKTSGMKRDDNCR
ncbi:uncharacterized protein LOC125041106 isoform X2 [Penaeus chinensis]|uniref:uncharacterized protein LOC125041106 isoform X2 n=1 Tax=Penaeus chinensis TaxID=139456 RepID=UPI001FB5D509|nr:uncharacterized protein LOC125041106 isoform X2 [Penaeus chinensis]